MKIKTSELEGAALDWAVALAVGENAYIKEVWFGIWMIFDNRGFRFKPSTDWSQGGPLIDKWAYELLNHGIKEPWTCRALSRYSGAARRIAGPTALIAAMRAIVASELGDEVDVPNELCHD